MPEVNHMRLAVELLGCPGHQQQILPALGEGCHAFPPGQRTADPQEICCVRLFSSLGLVMCVPSQEPSHP